VEVRDQDTAPYDVGMCSLRLLQVLKRQGQSRTRQHSTIGLPSVTKDASSVALDSTSSRQISSPCVSLGRTTSGAHAQFRCKVVQYLCEAPISKAKYQDGLHQCSESTQWHPPITPFICHKPNKFAQNILSVSLPFRSNLSQSTVHYRYSQNLTTCLPRVSSSK